MIYNTYEMHMPGSLPGSRLVMYLQDDSDALGIITRPLILVCPGGGYRYTSDREAEPIVLAFLAMGYHTALLRYSCAPARYPTALTELAYSIKFIRDHATEWHINPDQIAVQGCSAGGHLAASLGMFWNEDFLAQAIGLGAADREILRPDGMILCYPVVTSGEYAHRDSFKALLGEREAELSEKLSLEKQVDDRTPPAFIWGTYEDASVPMENSLLLVSALRRHRIPVEYHLYAKGSHGLALANRLTATADGRNMQEECASWVGLAAVWLKQIFPQRYKYQQ